MHVGMKCAALIIQITSAIVLRVVNRKRRPERHPQGTFWHCWCGI